MRERRLFKKKLEGQIRKFGRNNNIRMATYLKEQLLNGINERQILFKRDAPSFFM